MKIMQWFMVYGIKHGIDNLGNSQAKADMNQNVNQK